jgi:hypothetical protein
MANRNGSGTKKIKNGGSQSSSNGTGPRTTKRG